MKGFVIGVVATLVCIAMGAYIYFSGGYAPVATSAQAMPFEKRIARMALNAHVEKEAPKNAPIEANEANFTEGAKEYVEHCAVCHGTPGKPPGPIAEGEFPRPPQLFAGKGVTDDPPGETYWKIVNGIRLSGMPAYGKHLTDTQAWQLALLLQNADKLPASVTSVLAKPPEAELPAGHTHRDNEKEQQHDHQQ